jgi:hypothetical protein
VVRIALAIRRGSAALICGKAPPSRMAAILLPSRLRLLGRASAMAIIKKERTGHVRGEDGLAEAVAGRRSLPRKEREEAASLERQSLSASQAAEPHTR